MTHPNRLSAPLIAALILPLPALADLPPGLASARLLPGWTGDDGGRIAALELVLEPGWKTYWRSPGDTGLPPHFAWEGSANLDHARLHWPAPQAIRSGEVLEMGYHDRLVLPFTALPVDTHRPIDLALQISLGLCESICVPAHLDLVAPPPAPQPDPAILEALALEPQRLEDRPACTIAPIADGMQVTMTLPAPQVTLAAIELDDRPEIWVSGAEIHPGPDGPVARVDMVGPEGGPFDLDPQALRLTVIAEGGATEQSGCAD